MIKICDYLARCKYT